MVGNAAMASISMAATIHRTLLIETPPLLFRLIRYVGMIQVQSNTPEMVRQGGKGESDPASRLADNECRSLPL